ncbi:MAG: hypothetical protein GXO07_05345 [Crenarchaeota archaeon]|nr:hypothetical protein [Thermoproteota archaeon]
MRAAFVLVAHGSKNKKFYDMVERVAKELEGAVGGEVKVGYLMGEPSVEEAVRSAEGEVVVVVPFFISESSHVVRDVRERALKASNGRKVIFAKPLGDHPLVVKALLSRYLEALEDEGLRL